MKHAHGAGKGAAGRDQRLGTGKGDHRLGGLTQRDFDRLWRDDAAQREAEWSVGRKHRPAIAAGNVPARKGRGLPRAEGRMRSPQHSSVFVVKDQPAIRVAGVDACRDRVQQCFEAMGDERFFALQDAKLNFALDELRQVAERRDIGPGPFADLAVDGAERAKGLAVHNERDAAVGDYSVVSDLRVCAKYRIRRHIADDERLAGDDDLLAPAVIEGTPIGQFGKAGEAGEQLLLIRDQGDARDRGMQQTRGQRREAVQHAVRGREGHVREETCSRQSGQSPRV